MAQNTTQVCWSIDMMHNLVIFKVTLTFVKVVYVVHLRLVTVQYIPYIITT